MPQLITSQREYAEIQVTNTLAVSGRLIGSATTPAGR